MNPLKILDVLTMTPEEVENNSPDCGTCPISMRCAAETTVDAWTYDCCGATVVETANRTYILDCGNHFFKGIAKSTVHKCPLCTGDVIEWAERGNGRGNVYLRTLHAQVPAQTRITLWKKRHAAALHKIRRETLYRKNA
jgi:predicted RNA-binding Zn-ribbon protein involved in translation (DUF1610 family)